MDSPRPKATFWPRIQRVSLLRGGESLSLEPGEAYQRCVQALGPPHPEYEQALVCAVLSLDETLRSAVGELGGVAGQIRLASGAAEAGTVN